MIIDQNPKKTPHGNIRQFFQFGGATKQTVINFLKGDDEYMDTTDDEEEDLDTDDHEDEDMDNSSPDDEYVESLIIC